MDLGSPSRTDFGVGFKRDNGLWQECGDNSVQENGTLEPLRVAADDDDHLSVRKNYIT